MNSLITGILGAKSSSSPNFFLLSNSFIAIRRSLSSTVSLSKSSNFQQTLIADAGEESTILKSISSIKAQINGSLAMKVSLTIKNTSDVPEGVEETDSETAVTLVYGF